MSSQLTIARIAIQTSVFYLSWCSATVAEVTPNASISQPLSANSPIPSLRVPASPHFLPHEDTIDLAQVLPPPGTLEPTQPPQPLPDSPQPPPSPFFPTAPTTPSAPTVPPSDVTVKVKAVNILGSTVFSPEELQAAVQDFIDREIAFSELLGLRTAVTKLYTDNGYATSGAFLPPQDLTTGVVTIQVVEGTLERIDIEGLERLQEGYVRSRVDRAAKPPLNTERLEQSLQLLQLNPLLETVQAELSAGTAPGLSVLTLNIQEAQAFNVGVLGENTDSPTVGENSVTLYGIHRNLTGLGDRASFSVRDTRGFTQLSFGYEVPINPSDGTLSVRYAQSRNKVIEDPFAVLDIRSESYTLSFGFRQPIIRTPETEFTVGVSFDLRESQTFVANDRPFSFSLGPINGKSRLSVLRLTQEWVNRSEQRVLAARSQLNWGLNLFDPTISDSGVDADFVTWNGQFQWVEAFSQDSIFVARIGGQVAFDSLLSLEQFSIGGLDTVRGYRRNQRVGDSGFLASLEMRFTILRDPGGFGIVQLSPFFDVGTVWNYDDDLVPNPDPRSLASVGLSLNWQWNRTFSARVDWGVPLILIPSSGNTLQDRGVVFSIRFQPF